MQWPEQDQHSQNQHSRRVPDLLVSALVLESEPVLGLVSLSA
jgi:hypothetical protein